MVADSLKPYPRTVEEMLEQGWYEKILAKVKKAQLNDILNSPEEITQDIFVQIIQSDYLSRFNPELRSFEVYIYTMVINSIKKRGMREGSTNGRNIVNHNSLEFSQDDEGQQTLGVTYLDRIEQYEIDDPLREIEMADLLEKTRSSLRQFKASSSVIYEGVEIQRDAETVFNFILEGKTVPEIAEIFKTSKQFIYILLNKIRETPEMREFHEDFERTNLISSRGKRKSKSWANATF